MNAIESGRDLRDDLRDQTSLIKVLIVAPSLDITGGQSRQAVRLMEAFRQDPSLEIGFVAHNPRLPGPLRYLQQVKYLRTVLTTLYSWLLLLLKVPRYDIIHIFSASYYSYLLAAAPAILIARLFGKRCVINYRSGEAEDHLANWKLTAIPIIRLTHRIVTPSGYLVDVFAKFGLKAKAIFNIVELDRFSYRERDKLQPVFLVSRLLEPLYNVACVLRAFALIQERYPEAKLTVAGDGWLRPELEELARQLGLRETKFIGFVPFEKMPELYNETDIYLTATDIDNMPSSITECMASGVPVVTTDAGGIPYIVTHEETCLMVPRNDHQAMAEAAIRFLEEPGLAKRITQNARESSKRFMSPGVRAEWVKLYQELLPEQVLKPAKRAEA
jgi:glycosyltransferase involved in cell wall biosynthesis